MESLISNAISGRSHPEQPEHVVVDLSDHFFQLIERYRAEVNRFKSEDASVYSIERFYPKVEFIGWSDKLVEMAENRNEEISEGFIAEVPEGVDMDVKDVDVITVKFCQQGFLFEGRQGDIIVSTPIFPYERVEARALM